MVKILIAEDAELLRQRVAKMLGEAGFQTLEAENGYSAIEAYKTSKPDLVLMDITMPEMDGLAALRAILDHDPRARVVMLSALGQESAVVEALKAGASDFMIKPCERERVLNVISTLLG